MKKILFVSNTANFSKFNKPFMKWCSENGWKVDYCAPNDEIVTECDGVVLNGEKDMALKLKDIMNSAE